MLSGSIEGTIQMGKILHDKIQFLYNQNEIEEPFYRQENTLQL